MEPAAWSALIGAGMLFLVILGGIWKVFQAQIDGLAKQHKTLADELQRREVEIKARTDRIENEMVKQGEHIEFVKRVDQYMGTPFLTEGVFATWREEHDKRLLAEVEANKLRRASNSRGSNE